MDKKDKKSWIDQHGCLTFLIILTFSTVVAFFIFKPWFIPEQDNRSYSSSYSRTNTSTNTSTNSTSTSNSLSNSSISDLDEKVAVFIAANNAVKDHLKNPSSAKFTFSANDPDVAITCSEGKYTVAGWVEAENSYGGTLRQKFVVTFDFIGGEFVVDECYVF